MSLANQTCWVVGGVGVVGRGITRGLLQAGATVIVNSRSPERLETLQEGLGHPERLVAIHGSLLPGRASKTVSDALSSVNKPLNHVVSHGAVRWWARPTPGRFEFDVYRAGCDETYSLDIRGSERLLEMSAEDFAASSAQLASLHFSAAQQLVPRIRASGGPATYTFVTGDGSGKPGGERTSMGEINSHHVWGLSAALRNDLSSEGEVMCREIRVGLPVNEKKNLYETKRPLSEDVGNLCAGLAAAPSKRDDAGRFIKLEDRDQLDRLLDEYGIEVDKSVDPLPKYLCDLGIFEGEVPDTPQAA